MRDSRAAASCCNLVTWASSSCVLTACWGSTGACCGSGTAAGAAAGAGAVGRLEALLLSLVRACLLSTSLRRSGVTWGGRLEAALRGLGSLELAALDTIEDSCRVPGVSTSEPAA